MLTLCVGTLLAGALGSAVVPFLPFIVASIVAAVLGAIIAAVQGRFGLSVVTSAVGLLICTQVGYAIGLACLSFGVRRRRPEPMAARLDLGSAEVLGGPAPSGQTHGGSGNPP